MVPDIDYNKRNETQPEGFDNHFRPICKEGYSYVVDSYDATYKTIKYTKPKECSDCPFLKKMECQKVHEIRVKTDIQKYSPFARGSQKRKELYKKRSSLEKSKRLFKRIFPA